MPLPSDPSKLQERVFQTVHALVEDKSIRVSDETQLIGDLSVLDSMKLVELCLQLEDFAAEAGFRFDWTSESAMSRSRSMFRTAGSLAEEFIRQAREAL
jgi:acyl carrier protein